MNAQPKLIRLPEVLERVGLDKNAVYRLMAENQFPRQIKTGKRIVTWVDSEITEWIKERMESYRC